MKATVVLVVGLTLVAPSVGLSPDEVTSRSDQTYPPTVIEQNAINSTASVELDSNNTTKQTVVISKVRLPYGGFVAMHGVGYARRGVSQDSALTVSHYLSPGIHRNITISVKRGVPGIIANQSQLSYTRPNLSVIAYQDTNNNTQFDFVTSFGENDTPYQTSDGGPVVDTEKVILEENIQQVSQRTQSKPVRIQFESQQISHVDGHAVLTIRNITLPKGGFVVIHDKRYLGETRDPINSAIGLSGYLKPGVHRNVTVRLLTESINQTQILVAVAYLDTDGDHSYDFVRTGGEADYAYTAQQNGSTVIVNDTATVHVPRSQSQPTTTTTDRATIPSTTATPTAVASTEQTTSHKSEKGSGILEGSRLLIGAILVLILALVAIVKLRGGRN